MKKTRADTGRPARPAGPAPQARAASAPDVTRAGCPFGALLHRLAQKLHKEFDRALEPLGFSPPHYFVLLNLHWYGPRSQRELGGCAAINRTTMVSLIDHL